MDVFTWLMLARQACIERYGWRDCERCEGTGNELFSMYRCCSDCHGSGRLVNLPAS